MNPAIRASLSSFDVEIVYESREYDTVEELYTWLDPVLAVSDDQGVLFDVGAGIAGGIQRPRDLHLQPSTGGLVLSGVSADYPLVQFGAFGSTASWSDVHTFGVLGDPAYFTLDHSVMAICPDDDRVAMAWVVEGTFGFGDT